MSHGVRRRAHLLAVTALLVGATAVVVGALGGVDWFGGVGPASLAAGGLTALAAYGCARWTVKVRIGRNHLAVTLSALPTLVGALWLPPAVAVGAVLLGNAGNLHARDTTKEVFNTATAARSATVVVLVASLVDAPFSTSGVAALLICLAVLQVVEQAEVLHLVRVVGESDGVLPSRRERGVVLAVGVLVDGVALSLLAMLGGPGRSPLLVLAPLALLLIAVWAMRTYTGLLDAQRHLLGVGGRLFRARDAEEVLTQALAGVDTVLPVEDAAVVVEGRGVDGQAGLDVWRLHVPRQQGAPPELRRGPGADGLRGVLDRCHASGRPTPLPPGVLRLGRGDGLGAPFVLQDGTRGLLAVGGGPRSGALRHDDHRELLSTLSLQLGSALARARLDDALHVEIAQREHTAAHDALTGLANRVAWSDRTATLLSGSRRADGRVAVLVLDLTGFARCNDTLGHDAGDVALVEVARRLSGELRDPDVLARIGPDVFGVTLAEAPDLEHVVGVCERLLATFDEAFDLAGLGISLQARAGIALSPDHGDNAAVLLQHAELALATAKQERTAWSLHMDGDHETRRRRLVVRGRLRRAVAGGGLAVHLQPKVEAETGRIAGFEALARWHDADLGHVSPLEFIPEAEELGLMPALTCCVVDLALDALVELRRHDQDIVVAVNVSASAIVDTGVREAIRDGLADRALPAGCLVLELTESAVAGRGVVGALAELEQLGVRFSIDDYGTGYSSLSRLLQLKVDELKIDRSFVSAMVDDRDAAAIVRSTVELGRTLGMRTVAEGVEHDDEAVLLRRLGVDELQGWLTGRPMLPEAAVAWARARDGRWTPSPGAEAGDVVRLRPRRAG